MCLVLTKEMQDIKVAQEDIPILKVVFKVNKKGKFTFFNHSKIVYKTVLEIRIGNLHSHGKFITECDSRKYSYSPLIKFVSEGFHSFEQNIDSPIVEEFINEIKNGEYAKDVHFITGIIPKGSEYYHNPEIGCYVSNKIMYFNERYKYK